MERKVFISYSSKDEDTVAFILPGIENRCIPCWIAPRDISPGSDYAGSIVEAIRECDMILLIFSRWSNDSPQVKREIDRGVSLGKDIVAVRIEDTKPTGSMEYYLSPVHWFDCLRGPEDENLATLPDLIIERLSSRRSLRERTSYRLGKDVSLTTAYGDTLRSSMLEDERGRGILGIPDLHLSLMDPSDDPKKRVEQFLEDHKKITMGEHKVDRTWFELGIHLTTLSILTSSLEGNDGIQHISGGIIDLIGSIDGERSVNLDRICTVLREGPPYDMDEIYRIVVSLQESIGA